MSSAASILQDDINTYIAELFASLDGLDDDNGFGGDIAQTLSIILRLADDIRYHPLLLHALFTILANPDLPSDPQPQDLYNSVTVEDAWGVVYELEGLNRLINFRQPFIAKLNLRTLRNWLSLLNAVCIEAHGNHARLRFRYACLGPLGVAMAHIPVFFPEFLGKCYDYCDGWKKRKVFDTRSVEFMYGCLRGEKCVVYSLVRHVGEEIGGSFPLLRQDGGEVALDDLPIWQVMEELKAKEEGGGTEKDCKEWYQHALGDRLLSRISVIREDTEHKFGSILRRYSCLSDAEIERVKGQSIVLLKRELAARLELVALETRLITFLDLRHAYLTHTLNVFLALYKQFAASKTCCSPPP